MDDDTVQNVPRIPQVSRAVQDKALVDHLKHHLSGKDDSKDDVTYPEPFWCRLLRILNGQKHRRDDDDDHAPVVEPRHRDDSMDPQPERMVRPEKEQRARAREEFRMVA
jgi:hypothetical protein